MGRKQFNKTFLLTDESIAGMVLELEELLPQLKITPKNQMRLVLMTEEILLRWRDRLGGQAEVKVELNYYWGKPTVMLNVRGEQFNPLRQNDDVLGQWSDSMINRLGLRTEYNYRRGRNQVRIGLEKKYWNPGTVLIMSILGASLISAIGSRSLPPEVWNGILMVFFQPIYDMFFRILSVAASPAVFLSVVAVVYGIGNTSRDGKVGKYLAGHLVAAALFLSGIAVIGCMGMYNSSFLKIDFTAYQISELLDLLFQIVPGDVVTPFLRGDSPSLVFLGIVVGNALLIAGNQGEAVVNLSMQANNVMQKIMEWISKLIPGFVGVILVFQQPGVIFAQLNQPTLVLVVIMSSMYLFVLTIVSVTYHVQPQILIGKLWKTFRIAFINASAGAAYDEIVDCSQNKLGISRQITEYGVPLGLVVYMPTSGISFLVFTFQMASYYDVSISALWLITAVMMSMLLAIASPPIPGVNLMAYVVIFQQLDIPQEALIYALVADAIFTFFCAAMNGVLLELNMIVQADRLGMLDRDVLKKM